MSAMILEVKDQWLIWVLIRELKVIIYN